MCIAERSLGGSPRRTRSERRWTIKRYIGMGMIRIYRRAISRRYFMTHSKRGCDSLLDLGFGEFIGNKMFNAWLSYIFQFSFNFLNFPSSTLGLLKNAYRSLCAVDPRKPTKISLFKKKNQPHATALAHFSRTPPHNSGPKVIHPKKNRLYP